MVSKTFCPTCRDGHFPPWSFRRCRANSHGVPSKIRRICLMTRTFGNGRVHSALLYLILSSFLSLPPSLFLLCTARLRRLVIINARSINFVPCFIRRQRQIYRIIVAQPTNLRVLSPGSGKRVPYIYFALPRGVLVRRYDTVQIAAIIGESLVGRA